MNRYRRACWGGPCTDKGMATPGFCKCKADADEIERLRSELATEKGNADRGWQKAAELSNEFKKAKGVLDRCRIALKNRDQSSHEAQILSAIQLVFAATEQPAFDYFECPECGFSSVQKADFAGSETCPLCAGDSGHDVLMNRRTATSTDKPEGKDARKPTT